MSETIIPESTMAAMMRLCEEKYQSLVADGCMEDVARDRVWDAYCCALLSSEQRCVDPRDRLFENKLRAIREKGKK